MLIDATKATLLLIDMQERLLPAMAAPDEVEKRCSILLKAAKALDVPVAASEQYPKGLGHTAPALREEIGNAPVFEKTTFSCWRDPALKQHLIQHHEQQRPQVIVAGIEAHVCVMQTAADLTQAGFGVFVVADAVSSRAPSSVALALDRMRQYGVSIVNAEMVVFELLGKAANPAFKMLSGLIR
ncbi:MAG: hydrolase [Aestuariivirga sp.]